MFSGLLPVGTVVLLKESTKRVMIIGVCQKSTDDPDKLWDYCGCLYPEGYISADKVFLFNNENIDKVYAVGFQDSEQIKFKEAVEKALEQLRSQQKTPAHMPEATGGSQPSGFGSQAEGSGSGQLSGTGDLTSGSGIRSEGQAS